MYVCEIISITQCHVTLQIFYRNRCFVCLSGEKSFILIPLKGACVCARVNLCCVLLFSEITFPLEITIHRQQIIKFNLHLNVSYWCLTTMRWEEQHFVFAGTHKKICKLKFER